MELRFLRRSNRNERSTMLIVFGESGRERELKLNFIIHIPILAQVSIEILIVQNNWFGKLYKTI